MIRSNVKGPLQGIGKRALNQKLALRDGRDKVMEELKHISCAFAVNIARNIRPATVATFANTDVFNVDEDGTLHLGDISFPMDEDQDTIDLSEVQQEASETEKIHIPMQRIIEAARVIFSTNKLDLSLIEDFARVLDKRSPNDISDPPKSIAVHIQEWNQTPGLEKSSSWYLLWLEARRLSLIILAFAHVTDLRAAVLLPVSEQIASIHTSRFFNCVSCWDGIGLLGVEYFDWFEIVSILMCGTADRQDVRNEVCLLSAHGWSAFVNTFGDADPSSLSKFFDSTDDLVALNHSQVHNV